MLVNLFLLIPVAGVLGSVSHVANSSAPHIRSSNTISKVN